MTADQGAINLAGKLLTEAGSVGLWAKGDINLAASSSLSAQRINLSSQAGAVSAEGGSQLIKGTGLGQLTLTAGEQGLLKSRIYSNTEGWNLNAELWLQEEVADGKVTLAQLEAMNAKAETF